jgi:hypothetical protein
MKLFKTENNCLYCSNAIFKNWGHIRTYECKYNIIQDFWYCYRYRNPKLKELRKRIKNKRRYKC